jgi:hypothetical protein
VPSAIELSRVHPVHTPPDFAIQTFAQVDHLPYQLPHIVVLVRVGGSLPETT